MSKNNAGPTPAALVCLKPIAHFVAFALLLTVLLIMLTLLLTACITETQHSDETQHNTIYCEDEPFSEYAGVLKTAYPQLTIDCRNQDIFTGINSGAAVEAFDTQANPAIANGIASHWYPQYLATVVIAVDRGKTDAQIDGWLDLESSGEPVGMTNGKLCSRIMAAISYGLNGMDFSLHSATGLLSSLNRQKNLILDNYEMPVLICFDYQAAAMIKAGQKLEIIIPQEGTLSFEKGLLSNAPLNISKNAPDISGNRDVLIAAGFRMTDGSCNESIYPPNAAYSQAVTLTDYTHLNAEIQNATKLMRREVQNTHRYSSADGHEHLLFALVYIIAAILWSSSIAHRAMQKGVRRSAFFCCALLVGWAMARIMKYQISTLSILNRYMWYSYYIFELSIPLVLVWMALMIDKTEESLNPPKWWFYIACVNAALILIVLTNDLHLLVFDMDIYGTSWDKEYSYGLIYYFILALIFAQALLSQAIMVRKSRHSPKGRALLFPVGIYLLLGAFCIAYSLRLPIVAGSDTTIVIGVFTLMGMEACVQTGLIPVNRNYRQFFARSPHNMQIINDMGEMKLASISAKPIENRMWRLFLENPEKSQPGGENELIFAGAIRGGMIVWQEDISSINLIQNKIEASMEPLRRTNALLEQENDIQSKLASSKARSDLFSALEGEIRHRSEQLSHMLHNIPVGDERTGYIARVALLVCYIKRRCQLFFIEQNSRFTDAGELIVYMDELAEFGKVVGLSCFCNCILTGQISVRQATLIYDFFFSLLDWMQEHRRVSLFVQMIEEDRNVVMRVMPSGDLSGFTPEPDFLRSLEAANGEFSRKPLDDAEGFWLIFPREGTDSD